MELVRSYEKPEPNIAYRAAALSVHQLIKYSFSTTQVRGVENIPTDEPFIMALTHRSWFDIALSGLALYRYTDMPVDFVAKEELFSNRMAARALTRLNAIPVKRGENDQSAIQEVIKRLDQGRVVGVAPEGGVVKEDGLKLNKGIGIMACLANVSVLPVATAGDVKRIGLREHKVTFIPHSEVRFPPPVEPPEEAAEIDAYEVLATQKYPKQLLRMARIMVNEELAPAFHDNMRAAKESLANS